MTQTNKLHQGHFARKRFGQNFLTEQSIIDNIVAAINPKPDDELVEIGPGLAALTLPVADKSGKLTVIEIDRDLAERLKHSPFLKDKINVIQQDAMTIDFSVLAESKSNKLRVFGNLPYNISTPLMFHLFQYADAIQDMHFMLQKEVVNRLAAAPGTKTYGRLTVMAQYFCQVIPVLEVPPTAFKPAPKVDSAVVRLAPHQHKKNVVKDVGLLGKITTTAFSQRRKSIRNSLKLYFTESQLAELDFDLNLRAENISVEQYVMLTNYFIDLSKEVNH